MRLREFAPSPDRDHNDDVPDPIFVLANRWWNATDKQSQIEHVLNSLGWSIHQVESEDDAVQLQHRDGTTHFISADDFDPELFEISDDLRRSYLDRAGRQVDRRQERMAQVRDRLNKGYEIYHADRPANGKAIVDRFEADTPALARQYYEKFIHNYESDVDFDLQLRRATGIMEARVPRSIEGFLDSLNPDDVGVEEFGAYRVHFEGFTDDCQSSSDYRRNPDAVYDQVFADFVAREGGARPVDSGMVGDERYPILYSIFKIPRQVNEASSDEAWELVGQSVPEIQQFVKQIGYGNDEQSVAKITPIIDGATATQIPAASIPKLKNLANKGNDVQTLKAIQQISGRPDAAQQYTRLMQARDAGEGRNRGYPVGDLIQAVKSGNYEAPVLLKLPTGTYVVGGRTRLYAALALGIPAKVKIISANNFKQGVNEAVNPMRQQAGRMIDKYFGKIYEYGDSGLDYLDNHAPTWYGLSDQYNGDIDVIIATAPANLLAKAAQELKKVAGDLGYELSEAAGTPQYVTRIDSGEVKDFDSNMPTYYHTKDWSQSGQFKPGSKIPKNFSGKVQGTFAGDPHRTALYATGNANETRYVEFTQNGQPIVYFDKKDLPKMRGRKTYLTVFDAANFKKLPTGEYFSDNPGKPVKQEPIADPFQYIASQGWIVRTTDDLNKVFKQVQALHKAGKIPQYGGEGMDSQSNLKEIARIPQGDFGDADTLTAPKYDVKKKELPGGAGFTYGIGRPNPEDLEIMIFDGDTLAAELDLFYTRDATKAWRVSTVAVDPQYRSRGLGKALYGIALSILRLTLEAGDTQTKHGQRMWLMLNSIPGVEVMGYNMEPTEKYKARPGDEIIAQDDNWVKYTFPVRPGTHGMRSARHGTGMYTSQASMIAKWTGR